MKHLAALFLCLLLAACAGKAPSAEPEKISGPAGEMSPCDEMRDDPDFAESSKRKTANLGTLGTVVYEQSKKRCSDFDDQIPDCGVREKRKLVWRNKAELLDTFELGGTACLAPPTNFQDFAPWWPTDHWGASGKNVTIEFHWHGRGKSDFAGADCKAVTYLLDQKTHKIRVQREGPCR
jgi:hypothetical protein